MTSRIVTTLPSSELPVSKGNFDTTRAPIDRIVIHTMVGSWKAAAARFNNPSQQVSAHYGVKLTGGLIHWLEETFTAFHAGNYAMNQRSIGIEHEDGGDFNGVRPDALYTASAALVRDIFTFNNIPIDRKHILKHREIKATGCPDALDIERIVREAQGVPMDTQQSQKDVLRILDHYGVKTVDELLTTQDQQLDYLKEARVQVQSLQIQLGDAQGAEATAQNALKQKDDALSQAKQDTDTLWTTLVKGSTTITRDDLPSLAAFLTKASQDEDALVSLQKAYDAEVQQHKADILAQSERFTALQTQLNAAIEENDRLKEQAAKLGTTVPQKTVIDRLVQWIQRSLKKG